MNEEHGGDHDDEDDHKEKATTTHTDHDDHDRAHAKETAHHDHKDETKDAKHDNHDAAREASHSEFHATYVFTCAAPGKLEHIRVGVFEIFERSGSLQAQVIMERKQSAQRLTRRAPVIQLKP